MNPTQLLAHFEKIADAPDAIPRLRRFVLDLAVRGKLVPQNPKDEPASELLKRITAEKLRLIKVGRIKTPAVLPSLRREDVPFDLPSSWAWVRLGAVFEYDAGIKRDPKELQQDRWLLELEDIEKDTSVVLSRLRVHDRASLSTKSEFETGDILYGKLRPYLNKVVVADEPGYSTTEIVAVRPYLKLCSEYCAVALRRPDFVAYVERLGRGTKMPRLRTPDAVAAIFPLPPLPEQHRIVARVNELMALCDRLEAAQIERENRRDRLMASSLARLNAPDPDSFHHDARFAFSVLPALTARPDQVNQLRQTILNLAVRGKLVPQDPRDEPALNSLLDIRKKRNKLYSDKMIPKPKPMPQLDEASVPFQLPSGWTWSMLGELCYQVSDGPHFSPQYVPAEEGVPFLSTRNVRPDRFDLSSVKYVSRTDHAEFCKRVRPEIGDIIYTKGGTTGIARVNDLDFEFSVWVHLAVLRIEKVRLNPKYVELALNSPHCYGQSQKYTQGTSNFDLGLTRMIKITVPLPPLAEQARIVAKVGELMAACNRLEASLRAGDERRSSFLKAILGEALRPTEERDEAA